MLQVALATIFALAAASKLADPTPPRALSGVRVSQAALVRATRALSIGELALVVGLLSPLSQLASSAALAFLVLTGAIVLLQERANAPDCGCFGSRLQVADRQLRAVRHVGFVVIAGSATLMPFAPTVFDVLTGVCVGLAFVLMWPLLSTGREYRQEVRH